jgi:hypothetical protein
VMSDSRYGTPRVELVLRGIAVWAPALQERVRFGAKDEDEMVLESTRTKDKPYNISQASFSVSIQCDENMSGPEVDPQRWPSHFAERASDLLCMGPSTTVTTLVLVYC